MKLKDIKVSEQDARDIDVMINYIIKSGRNGVCLFELSEKLFNDNSGGIARGLRVKAIKLSGDNYVFTIWSDGTYGITEKTQEIMRNGGFLKLWRTENRISNAPNKSNKIAIWGIVIMVLLAIIGWIIACS